MVTNETYDQRLVFFQMNFILQSSIPVELIGVDPIFINQRVVA